jgi:methionyl-tRNA formyltransferase
MKIVFIGTGAFAMPSLQALAQSAHHIIAVVTQPDRGAGRGQHPRPSPVKLAALELDQALLQPEKIGSPESLAALQEAGADIFLVVSYGQILPKKVLDLPRLGCINLHASLLPKYRGAAPLQRALMAGETKTGLTTMWMSEGCDEGDIIQQQSAAIQPDETYGELHDRLAHLGAELLLMTLGAVERGEAARHPQKQALASFAPPINPKERKIAWDRPAEEIYNLIRALNPTPGAFCLWRGKRLKIWKAEKALDREGVHGVIIELTSLGPVVATGTGGLRLLEVQPEGRRRISASEFMRGYHPVVGEKLE